jgi:hypothetical protein
LTRVAEAKDIDVFEHLDAILQCARDIVRRHE